MEIAGMALRTWCAEAYPTAGSRQTAEPGRDVTAPLGAKAFAPVCRSNRSAGAICPGYAGSLQTPSNSRHSPLDMPDVSCVTTSPFSRRLNTSIAFPLNVVPPSR